MEEEFKEKLERDRLEKEQEQEQQKIKNKKKSKMGTLGVPRKKNNHQQWRLGI